MFTYGSVCSGIGSECVAWSALHSSSLEWKSKWFSEIDPFCCSLLRQRYPDVKNLGNMRHIDTRGTERVELIVGGTPCQSFSINSKGREDRKGLDDSRGQLSLTFTQIIKELRPRWVLWENVPNALRVDRGNAFRCISTALSQCGYGWAYRVLDLQGFGVPQRRRRLFLVANLGSRGMQCAAAVLFDTKADKGSDVSPTKKWKGSMGGVSITKPITIPETWIGDSTPKRSVGCIASLRSGQGAEGIGYILGDRNLRTLTINEMEILQGFPPEYTNILYKRKPATVSQRRKVIGNSFPPPILHWIGRRIDFIHNNLPNR